jgi:hypothetical protein
MNRSRGSAQVTRLEGAFSSRSRMHCWDADDTTDTNLMSLARFVAWGPGKFGTTYDHDLSSGWICSWRVI